MEYDFKSTMKMIKDRAQTESLNDPIKYNEGIRAAWEPIWVHNTVENYQFIKECFSRYEADIRVFPRANGKPAIICGSGPSLDEMIPLLKDWKGDIFCSSSQLNALVANGIKPTACCIIDSDPRMGYLITDIDTTDIPLLTHPNIDPFILQNWKGKVYFFRMFDPGDQFFSRYVPLMYSHLNEAGQGIGSFVLNSGCVVNTLIAVLNSFGYSPIFLSGVEFGFPEGHYRFTDYKKLPDGTFEKVEPAPTPAEAMPYKGNNGVPTDKVSIFYKYSTYVLYGMDAPQLISCSKGLLTEIPYCSPLYVVQRQGNVDAKFRRDPKEMYKIAQTYLYKRGVYIKKGKKVASIQNSKGLKGFKKLSFLLDFHIGRMMKKW